MSIARPVPEAVNTAPGRTMISLPAVGPALETLIEPAVMDPSVMSPLVGVMSPAPGKMRAENAPVPALIETPEAIVISAAPVPRLALTVARSEPPVFASSVRAPLSVTMLALSRIERPARRVIAPPLPDELLTVKAEFTVMSLEASKLIDWPVDRNCARADAETLLVPVALSPKASDDTTPPEKSVNSSTP